MTTAAPPLTPTPTIPCHYCGREMHFVRPGYTDMAQTIMDYSEGCYCRLSSETLRGLLSENEADMVVYKLFRTAWYKRMGLEETTIKEMLRFIKFPLPDGMRRDVAKILSMRAAVRFDPDLALFSSESEVA